MKNGSGKILLAAWFSGFLAWGAIGHLTRLIWGTSLVVGCYEITMPVSAIIAVVLAAGSLLLAGAVRKHCRAASLNQGTCPGHGGKKGGK